MQGQQIADGVRRRWQKSYCWTTSATSFCEVCTTAARVAATSSASFFAPQLVLQSSPQYLEHPLVRAVVLTAARAESVSPLTQQSRKKTFRSSRDKHAARQPGPTPARAANESTSASPHDIHVIYRAALGQFRRRREDHSPRVCEGDDDGAATPAQQREDVARHAARGNGSRGRRHDAARARCSPGSDAVQSGGGRARKVRRRRVPRPARSPARSLRAGGENRGEREEGGDGGEGIRAPVTVVRSQRQGVRAEHVE